jgi:hypothetical protein
MPFAANHHYLHNTDALFFWPRGIFTMRTHISANFGKYEWPIEQFGDTPHCYGSKVTTLAAASQLDQVGPSTNY